MDRPKIVCLCGSTKFKVTFEKVMLEETLKGNIVLTLGCASHSGLELFGHLSFNDWMKTKKKLDNLHFEKIKLADEIIILNVGGYIGISTCDEIGLALAHNKPIIFIEPTD